eukprot:TRINITY_DN10367_c0_g1_i1.p1 TRINITY_DN10367_c0_g1~~TRINITY_DN10367_c0_g1_i1.p1  ORF type:complete len:274 (-),score=95.05 TRINITY_DN10367_c0_g1_i1:35-856(-)
MPSKDNEKKRKSEKLMEKVENVVEPSKVFDNSVNSSLAIFEINSALSHLMSNDANMSTAIKNCAKLSPFHSEEKDSMTPFESLVRAIVYQQLSGKAASTIFERFKGLFEMTEENPFPSPKMILEKSIEELRSAGLSNQKVNYLRDLSSKFEEKKIPHEDFSSMSDEEISKCLIQVKGIGQWTADMFLMFYLKRPDVLPTLDLGIKKGMIKHFELPPKEIKKKILLEHEQMVKLAECWRPYRSLGSWYMWQILDNDKEVKKEKSLPKKKKSNKD